MIDLQALPSRKVCACVVTAPNGLVRLALPSCLSCCGSGLRDTAREKIIARNATRRIPTTAEFVAFDGAHCRKIYAGLPSDWRCPACRRDKYELLRWATLFPHSRAPFMGWAVGLHKHHDHQADSEYFESGWHASGRVYRFQESVVCEQCNSADSTVKKRLQLPKWFSFAPAEIAQFVFATAHGWHLYDYETAARIYGALPTPAQAAKPMFF